MKYLKQWKKKIGSLFELSSYTRYYYKKKIHEKMIFVESNFGKSFGGNMFAILCELSKPAYAGYEVYLSCTEKTKPEMEEKLKLHQIDNVHLVIRNKKQYLNCLCTAHYLFTDVNLGKMFIKREGQIVTNTWHGTPLKKMGKDVDNRAYAMGNVQRNLLAADYLVYPNDYMREKMVGAYCLNEIYQGTILSEGYPRNSVFFDSGTGRSIREELDLTGKQVYIYMPTWRGTLTDSAAGHLMVMLEYYLLPLDQKMKEDQVLYVKLHPFVTKELDYSRFKHIRPYPGRYDGYEFLNMCDGLITDYSSVLFDFANTRKKIILFCYDETEYLKERGLYFELNEMPFPVVKTVDQLAEAMAQPKNYDDTEFRKKFCTYDGPGAAGRICRHVVLGEKVCTELSLINKEKQNVLIYASSFAKNGITTSILNLLKNIDLSKRNYYISFQQERMKLDPERVRKLPPEVEIMPFSSENYRTALERFACWLRYSLNLNLKFSRKYMDRMYQRDIQKNFGNVKLNYVIQFSGYEKEIIDLYLNFKAKRIVFVHNDMVHEVKQRNNQHLLTIQRAYREFEKVAVVTEDIYEPTVQISGRKDNIVIVNNCNADRDIIERSEFPAAFDEDTKSNISEEELREILDSDARKFITIGRFSPEKGHQMLMKAFEKYSLEYPDTCLIIIGGHGVLYKETLKYARNSDANIVVIKSMSNPMPVLKKCGLFILSSYYEGLGLVMLEADTLGVPVISTDVNGPRGFLREHGGTLVEVSEQGIYNGMKAYIQGDVKTMNVDYDRYNQHAVEQFESLFEADR